MPDADVLDFLEDWELVTSGPTPPTVPTANAARTRRAAKRRPVPAPAGLLSRDQVIERLVGLDRRTATAAVTNARHSGTLAAVKLADGSHVYRPEAVDRWIQYRASRGLRGSGSEPTS